MKKIGVTNYKFGSTVQDITWGRKFPNRGKAPIFCVPRPASVLFIGIVYRLINGKVRLKARHFERRNHTLSWK
jgi:hypothetical protein